MHHVFGNIVRRGLDTHAALRASGADDGGEPDFQLPTWSLVLLAATVLLFVIFLGMAEYTYGQIIPTLCAIESPTAVLFEPVPKKDVLDNNGKDDSQSEQNVFAVKQTLITSSFRKTLSHLRQKAGCGSRFRGISIWLVYQLLYVQLTTIISTIRFIPRPQAVDAILAAVVLANLQMAWTHIVITEPSKKPWFKRLPSTKLWRKVAIPTAIFALCAQVVVVVPAAWLEVSGMSQLSPMVVGDMDGAGRKLVVGKFFVGILLAVFCYVAVVIPATVTLIRVQASLLTEEEETIVPFDRSFGGRATPAVLGGSGVGMLVAWKTFNWNSRARFLLALLKAAAIELAITVSFMIVFALQLHFVIGKENCRKWVEAYMRGH